MKHLKLTEAKKYSIFEKSTCYNLGGTENGCFVLYVHGKELYLTFAGIIFAQIKKDIIFSKNATENAKKLAFDFVDNCNKGLIKFN